MAEKAQDQGQLANEEGADFVISGAPVEPKETPKEEPQNEENLTEVQPEKTEADAVQQVQGETEESVLRDERVEQTSSEEPQEIISEEKTEEVVEDEPTVIEEIVEEPQEDIQTIEEPSNEQAQSGLPEGVDKLVQFIQETGGTVEDYLRLNQDYSKLSDEQLLIEYYANTKPEWDRQDILDHIQDEFTIEDYEEGMELEREDRTKLRNRKAEIANAKRFLDQQKAKYYEDIKMNSQAQSKEQVQAQQEAAKKQQEIRRSFENQTKELFSEDFKGFDFDAGEKRFRIKENAQKLYESQVDLNAALREHLGDNGIPVDASKYHKSLYAFMNPDKLFAQAYQQGKADAIKERATNTKNIDMTPKTDATPANTTGKLKLTIMPDENPFGL